MSPFFLKEIYRKTRFELDKGSFYLKKYPYLDSQRKEIEEISDLQLRIAYRNFIEDKLPTILRNWDRASMSHGVEIRMPFMDYRLVEFIFSLDGSHKINKHYTKSILREAASGLIPEDIRLRRNKIGINAPMVEWFNGSFNNFILDITRSKNFVESNIWNGRLVGSKIEKLCSTKSWTQSDCNQFWPYINTSLLMP